MKAESKLKKFIASIKSKKHLEIVVAVIAVVIMLVLYFSARSSSADENSVSASSYPASDYCEKTEANLAAALEAMHGVGKVQTVIAWESGVEKVIAYATSNSGSNISTTPTVIQAQGVSSPIVLKELYPKALGVIIICQGGNDVAVRLDIMNAVSALLNIPQNKVNVYAMK